MNIKGLTPSLIHLDPRVKTDAKDALRLKNSGDRDANGQRQQPEPERKNHLSDEEFEAALKTLGENPGVAQNHLQIRVEKLPDCRIVYVEDLSGKVVHRLSEADLWLVTREKDRPTGKILDKSG
jgi:hypothetical protein